MSYTAHVIANDLRCFVVVTGASDGYAYQVGGMFPSASLMSNATRIPRRRDLDRFVDALAAEHDATVNSVEATNAPDLYFRLQQYLPASMSDADREVMLANPLEVVFSVRPFGLTRFLKDEREAVARAQMLRRQSEIDHSLRAMPAMF